MTAKRREQNPASQASPKTVTLSSGCLLFCAWTSGPSIVPEARCLSSVRLRSRGVSRYQEQSRGEREVMQWIVAEGDTGTETHCSDCTRDDEAFTRQTDDAAAVYVATAHTLPATWRDRLPSALCCHIRTNTSTVKPSNQFSGCVYSISMYVSPLLGQLK